MLHLCYKNADFVDFGSAPRYHEATGSNRAAKCSDSKFSRRQKKAMGNFKKVIAMVMVFAMAFSFMAGAAYKDESAISSETKAAVDMLNALNTMVGKPNGNFDPETSVTRAEMAKMIYVIRNRGNDDAGAAFKGLNLFSDIGGHWAEGYINYAASLGLVSGVGGGRFDPDASVTGVEAAKMLLTMLGFNAEKEQLVGTQWVVKTTALAMERGILDNYTPSLTAAAPRQWAALLIYNALFANTVRYVDGVAEDEVRSGETLTSAVKYLGLEQKTGIVTDATDENISVKGAKDDKATVYEVKNGYKLLGHEVKVLFKNANNELTVYDAYATTKNGIVNTTVGAIEKLTSSIVKIDGKEYKVDAGFQAVYNYDLANADDLETSIDKLGDGYDINMPVKLVDNNGDGKYDFAFIEYKSFGKLSIQKDSFRVSVLDKNTSWQSEFTSIDKDDADIYDDAAKDDLVWVMKNAVTGRYTIEKASSFEGKVDGLRQDEFRVNGTFYSLSADHASSVAVPSVGDSHEFFTDGKFVIYMKEVSKETPKNFAFVIAQNTDAFGETSVKVLLEDGTTKVMTLNDKGVQPVNEKLYTYSISDNQIKLSEITDAGNVKLGADVTASFNSGDKKIGDAYYVSDDAVIFTKYQKNDGTVAYKTLSGKEVNKFSANFASTATTNMAYTEVNGFNYVVAGALINGDEKLPSTSGTEWSYAYATENEYMLREDDTDVMHYDNLWNGMSFNLKHNDSNTFISAKGEFIKYKLEADGTIGEIAKGAATKGKLTGFDLDSKRVSIDGSMMELNDDYKIIYIDSDNKTGAEGDGLKLAEDGVNNIAYVVENGEVVVLFVDVNNEMV